MINGQWSSSNDINRRNGFDLKWLLSLHLAGGDN